MAYELSGEAEASPLQRVSQSRAFPPDLHSKSSRNTTRYISFYILWPMSLPHVLLGLLTRGAGSGWDLKARLARDPSVSWDAELAQIYPALKTLLRGGYVAMKRRRSTKGPARREYRITPSGRRELLEWLAEPPRLPRAKDAALARLAFLERARPEERAAHLHAYRSLLADALKRAGPASSAARRRRRALLETELAWADAEMGMEREPASDDGLPASAPGPQKGAAPPANRKLIR